MNTKRWMAMFAAAAMTVTACSGGGGEQTDGTGPTTTGPGGATNTPVVDPPSGGSSGGGSTGVSGASTSASQLGLILSEGQKIDTVVQQINVAEGTQLSDAEVAAVLDRLPEWSVPDTDVVDFNRPVDSLTPPVVGDTLTAPFPPSLDAPTVPDAQAEGPLEVLRFQPDGDVDIAPFIAITFNEPMVELATLDQLDAIDVPVEVTPDIGAANGIEGRWRWIGTRTLRFEVIPTDQEQGGLDRLPASTDYTVTVPAETESVNGAVLDDAFSFTFSTPPATVTRLDGLAESMGLDPVFVAFFDQRVDPAAVLDVIDFDAGDVTSVRLATDAEIDEDVRRRLDSALPDRAFAFVPTSTLSTDTSVSVTIGPAIPSLEGPRTSSGSFSESGRTYAPLRVNDTDCRDRCPPFAPFEIEFNNEVDRSVFDPTWINVEPAVPGLRVNASGSFLRISGATSGNTTYTVTIAPDIADVFGQTLGEEFEEEFDVGDALPFFVGPQRDFVTTDPFAETPSLSYTTVNHEQLSVRAWQVTPSQFEDYRQYVRDFRDFTYRSEPGDEEPQPGWPVVLETTVDIDADTDEIAETVVDLSSAFAESGGPIVVMVGPDPAVSPDSDDFWRNEPAFTWVQTSTLGIDAFSVGNEILVWTTDLLTGEPVANAQIEFIGTGQAATTDADGVARVPLTTVEVTALVATSGDRSVMLRTSGWSESSQRRGSSWYVIDDRGIYRPGETVSVTGLVRGNDDDAQITQLVNGDSVRYTVFDPQGNELVTDTAPLNVLGGFNLSIDLPEASNTGFASIEMVALDAQGNEILDARWNHNFQVQDFRTPEYEVDVRAESPAPYYVVEPATVAVDAEYFAGGPLGDSEVNWFVSTTDSSYNPPNWHDFSFGVWTPWWYSSYEDDFGGDEFFPSSSNNPRYQEFVGRTDAGGTHLLQIDFADTPASSQNDDDGEPMLVDQPTTVRAEATVFDVNRQAISSQTSLLVHPARYYVGLRSDRGWVEQGDPIVIDATVVDVDGAPVAGRTVDVTAGRIDTVLRDDRYVREIVDEQTCTITSSDTVTNDAPDAAMRCEFTTDVGGRYEITAIVGDDDGRQNRAVYTQWVSGSSVVPTRDLEQGEVTIIPDAENYAPGDTAELLVQAPFAPASGLVIVTRAGVESVMSFDAPDGSAIISVPVASDDIPNLNVRVDMVGATDRTADDGTPAPDAPKQPAFAVGEISLAIPPVERTLSVTATPEATELAPGESTSVSVSVLGADGEPVADAGVALIVVDEAVLSLSGYELLDPVSVFYGSVSTRLRPELLRNSIILANPDLFVGGGEDDSVEAMEEESAPASVEADGDFAADTADGAAPAEGRVASGNSDAPIDLRDNFDALAVFAPDEATDASGQVTVAVDLPDNLTRYRVMAVSFDGVDRFGSGESNITARLPISVRPSAPRFLNFGDRFELPVVVQNLTDGPLDVDVAIETANLDLTDGAGRRVTVPANDRIEVRFPAEAADVGTARFRVASVSGEFADAAAIALPVYTPATSEAFATYGVIDGDAAVGQPMLAPTGVFPQFGGLEISTSSTALQALTDSVLYLYEYRYDSADGYASRIMAVAALRDVLDAFDAAGLPDAATLDTVVADDIASLQALQNNDGGFPRWQRSRESIPWVSVQATHAQVLAQQNGYPVDQFVLDVSLDHLRAIEDFIPQNYSQSTKDAISAYALYVRAVAGDDDPAKALALYRRGANSTLQIDSIAQLWTVITDPEARDEIERMITNAAVETPSAATFATSYGEDAYVITHSSRRTDGMILDALVRETPDSDLIVKVVTGLLGNQTRGRWNNAQENSFILLALNEYFDTFESIDPDFVARAWLGDTYAAEAEFRERSTDTSLTTVPMADVIAAGDNTIVIDKDGAGRLYYRLALSYAPDDLDLDPRDEGFVVERIYEAVDDPTDVVRNADGSWQIAAGATVRVRLTMVADARRTQVALIDPLPAGLEPVNPAFATSPSVVPEDSDFGGGRFGYWWWRWFDHQNLRDDRVEAFSEYLSAGTYEYTYIARATTPGEFVVPPTRAEEIFAPEVFGRSASDSVTVS